jgi:hypothetical protein
MPSDSTGAAGAASRPAPWKTDADSQKMQSGSTAGVRIPGDSTEATGGCDGSGDPESRAKLCKEAIWLSLCKCAFVATSLHTRQYGAPPRMSSQSVRCSPLRAAKASSNEQFMWVQAARGTHPEET